MSKPSAAQIKEHERLVKQLIAEGYEEEYARLKASIRLGLPLGDRQIPASKLDDPEG